MESFFKGRDIWIVSSVCLVASFLWHRLWDLLLYRRKGRGSSSADAKVGTPGTGCTGVCTTITRDFFGMLNAVRLSVMVNEMFDASGTVIVLL